MKLPISGRVRELAGYQPGEQPRDATLVKLNTNENPYPHSPRVTEALARAASEKLNLYPQPLADDLREKAAERYGVAPAQVLVGNGSDELLALCLRACVVDGDSVAYPVPSYSLYRTLVAIAGGRAVEVAAAPGQLPASLGRCDPKVSFLCTPNSPFGSVLAPRDIGRYAAGVDGLVVADEAYADFAETSALALLGQHDNLIVVRSFSKSFSLAGLRLGLAFADADVIAEIAKVKDSYNVSRLAIAAGVAALDDYAWMEANVARVRATRERVTAALRSKSYGVLDSHANFVWVDCSAADGGRAVYQRLRERDVLVRFFDTAELRHGIRVTIGSDEQIDRFLDALE